MWWRNRIHRGVGKYFPKLFVEFYCDKFVESEKVFVVSRSEKSNFCDNDEKSSKWSGKNAEWNFVTRKYVLEGKKGKIINFIKV